MSCWSVAVHSNAFSIATFFFPLALIVWQSQIITTSVQYTFAEISANGTTIASQIWWFGSNGYILLPIITAPLYGLWVNVAQSRKMMIVINLVTAVFCIVYSVAWSISTVIICQLVFGMWAGSALVCTLSYFSRAISLANRTMYMVMVCFVVNSLGPAATNALVVAMGTCPSVSAGGFVLFGGLLLSALMFFILPEHPISEAVGDLYVEGRPGKTLRRTCKRYWRCADVLAGSLPAILALLFVINATMFGFQVYSSLLNEFLNNQTDKVQAGLVYGLLALSLGATVILAIVVRFVSDRVLLVVFAVFLLLGYLLVIAYGGVPVPPARYISGAAIIMLSDNLVLAIGTSLYTKVVSPLFQGIWIGILVGTGWFAQLLAVFWVDFTRAQRSLNNETPYELTLALVGVALLLMIPIYRRLLPQLFSPWSGSALPTKALKNSTDAVRSYGSLVDSTAPTTESVVHANVGHVQIALKHVVPLSSHDASRLD